MQQNNTKCPQVSKMKRILCPDWLPELASSELLDLFPKEKVSLVFGHIINPLITKLVRSRWLF